MLSIRIELLTGRYAATRFNDRNLTEWPPHPARLFSALVATWADADEPDTSEREALTWFESLGAPDISASEASPRNPVIFYVPNNEAASTVVSDQSRNYVQLAEKEIELARANAQLVQDPENTKTQKDIDRIEKELVKLHSKIKENSLKGSARKTNETEGTIGNGIQLLPDERGRQARTFPVVIPHSSVVFMTWPEANPTTEVLSELDRLLARIARLGHSSSMVSCTLVDDPPPPTLVPTNNGGTAVRVTAPGLLDELELAYKTHKASEPRALPSVFETYGPVSTTEELFPQTYLDDEWIVLSDVSTDKLPLVRALDLTMSVRGALLSFADDPLPEILSGHEPGEKSVSTPSSKRPHLAVVALPFVASKHSDGNIRGVGLILPREASSEDRAALAGAVNKWVTASGNDQAEVKMGRLGIRRLTVSDQFNSIETLKSKTWCRPAHRWVSVTPVALDRFPGELWSTNGDKRLVAEDRATQVIKKSFTHVGLPEPDEVEIVQSAPLVGVPDLRRFPTYRSPGRKLGRMGVHVRVTFKDPVSGPVLVGAGRYYGYGLLCPLGPRPLADSGLAIAGSEVAS